MTLLNLRLYGRAENPFGDPSFVVPISRVPSSQKPAIISVCTVCLVASWVAVVLRFWTRAAIMKFWGYDDLFMFITIVNASYTYCPCSKTY
jgi:hypothetical protein